MGIAKSFARRGKLEVVNSNLTLLTNIVSRMNARLLKLEQDVQALKPKPKKVTPKELDSPPSEAK